MPYLTCDSCGLPTYCVSEGTCPACGTALKRTSPPVGPRPAAVGEVDAKLQMACRELKADAALVTEIRDGREHIRWAAGVNWAGRSYALRDTICERLLSGRIGSVVPDTHADPALKGVALGDIAAYIGVPFKTADARAYVLCCLAYEARPDLGEADVRFLKGLAESLRPVLEIVKRLVLAAAVVMIGCGGEATTQTEPAQSKGVRLQKVGDFSAPVYVTAPPADKTRVFVVEQGGTIQVLNGSKKSTFLDITNLVESGGEQGLLSMAFAPDYASSGLFYVYYTDSNGDEQIVEYKRSSDDKADPGSARQVLMTPDDEGNHNGGQLQFGPDKLLYIGTGDGGGGGDQHGPRGNGQNLGVLLGKILRIDPKASGGKPYTVPADNPFVKRSGARPEIYSYGLRNPWRFSFDRSNGAMTIGDVGQGEWEEINYRAKGKAKGANFGWRVFEGEARYADGESAPGHVKPLLVESHSAGNCSITGGYVIRDPALKAWSGRYVFGDYCRGVIQTADTKSGKVTDRKLKVESLSSFGEDARGRVYATSLDGPVYRLTQ